MRTKVSLIVQFPFARHRQFILPLWAVGTAVGVVLLLPAAILTLRVPAPPLAVPQVPALATASVSQGTLHFGVGGRDWKPSELRVPGARALPLKCMYYRGPDACFTIQQGNDFEGKVAKVWWTPELGVLQLKVGDEMPIRYEDTVARLERLATEQRSVELVPFPFFVFFLGSILTLIGFLRIRLATKNGSPAR